MADCLPEDVIVGILERLPIKSLIRFTSVSKFWRFIISSDPNFAKSQFQQTRSRRNLLYKDSGFESRNLETPWSTGDSRKLSCPFMQPGHELSSFASSNGLVCAAFNRRNEIDLKKGLDIYIWNPSTQFFTKLPALPDPLQVPYVTYYGFGYLSAADDYKILIGNSYSWTRQDHIFSFNTGVWKRIETPFGFQRKFQWILSNEALHWCNNDNKILAFDLANEKFGTMPMPGSRQGEYSELGDYNGCLCTFDVHNLDSAGTIDLWVMKQYNVGESWAKIFTLKISDQPVGLFRLKPFVVMKTSTILKAQVYKGLGKSTEFKLVKSCHEEEKYEAHEICYQMYDNMIGYEETLLRLG